MNPEHGNVDDSPNCTRKRAAVGGALAIAVAIGLWPYLPYLNLGPVKHDAVIWLTRSEIQHPHWFRNVFLEEHFSGYRPVTSFSYTLNSLASGLEPFSYRLVDLFLHAAIAILVALLVRRLAPRLSAMGAVAATALFIAHPGAAEVVPFLARRSYSLATIFSLAALLSFSRSLGNLSTQPARSVRISIAPLASGLLFAFAILCNEIALASFPVFFLIAYLHAENSRRWRSLFSACTLPIIFTLAAISARLPALGGIGGYGQKAEWSTRAASAFTQFWRELFGWDETTQLLGFAGASVAYGLIAAYYLWRVFTARFSNGLGVFLLWLLTLPVFVGLLGEWFPRMLYPALVPFSALLAAALFATPTMGTAGSVGRRTAVRVGHLVPQLLLVALVYTHSPGLGGLSATRLQFDRAANALLVDLRQQAMQATQPADILLALPFRPTRLSHAGRKTTLGPSQWVRAVLRDHDLRFDPFLFYDASEESAPTPQFEKTQDGAFLVLASGQTYQRGISGQMKTTDAPRRMRIDSPADPSNRRARYLYIYADGAGELVKLRGVRSGNPNRR